MIRSGVADAVGEEMEPEVAVVDRAGPSTVARVLAGDDVVLGMGHETEHDDRSYHTRRRCRRPTRWGSTPA